MTRMKVYLALMIGVLFSVMCLPAMAQNYPASATDSNSKSNSVTPVAIVGSGGTTYSSGLPVNCVSGCGGSGSSVVTQPTASLLNATVVGTGTFSVQNTAATPAGTNLVGKVGIDQTTPGTTNAVSASGTTTAADTTALTNNVKVQAIPTCYNGTTVDLQRSLTGMSNGTTTGLCGVAAVGFQGFFDNNTALTSNQNFIGSGRTVPLWAGYFQCRAYADQSGTLTIEESDDNGTTYQPVTTASAITASAAAALARVNVTGQPGTTLYHCRVVNGAVANTISRITSSFTAN